MELNAIVEIPRGSQTTFELDKDSGIFRFDRLLYSAVHYPGDYGFIPRTLAEDDPLDVLIMVTEPTFTGCLIVVAIGEFRMQDRGDYDDKIRAVPLHDPLHDSRDLADAPKHFLKEVEHFFAIYKDLEGGKTTVIGWEDRDRAHAVIQDAVERYRRTYPGRAAEPDG